MIKISFGFTDNNTKYTAWAEKILPVGDFPTQWHIHDLQPNYHNFDNPFFWVYDHEKKEFPLSGTPEQIQFQHTIWQALVEACMKKGISLT